MNLKGRLPSLASSLPSRRLGSLPSTVLALSGDRRGRAAHESAPRTCSNFEEGGRRAAHEQPSGRIACTCATLFGGETYEERNAFISVVLAISCLLAFASLLCLKHCPAILYISHPPPQGLNSLVLPIIWAEPAVVTVIIRIYGGQVLCVNHMLAIHASMHI